MSLVMRLETLAAKLDRQISYQSYDLKAADIRDILQEAARRIKMLEVLRDPEAAVADD